MNGEGIFEVYCAEWIQLWGESIDRELWHHFIAYKKKSNLYEGGRWVLNGAFLFYFIFDYGSLLRLRLGYENALR